MIDLAIPNLVSVLISIPLLRRLHVEFFARARVESAGAPSEARLS